MSHFPSLFLLLIVVTLIQFHHALGEELPREEPSETQDPHLNQCQTVSELYACMLKLQKCHKTSNI